MGFYSVYDLENFKVTDIPSAEDRKQNLAIGKNGPNSYTSAELTNLVTAGFFKTGAVVYNTTTSKFQGFNGVSFVDLN